MWSPLASRLTYVTCVALAVTGCDGDHNGALDGGIGRGSPVLATGAPATELNVPDKPSRAALDELLARAPEPTANPTDPDGGTLVGSDTGIEEEEQPAPPPKSSAAVVVRAGNLEVQPQFSSVASEKAAREQIYWNLRKCMGPNGKPPPPDSILLMFTLRPDGTIDPATVKAKATDKRLDPTAECVVRELSAAPFQGPAASLHSSPRVMITWPSVD